MFASASEFKAQQAAKARSAAKQSERAAGKRDDASMFKRAHKTDHALTAGVMREALLQAKAAEDAAKAAAARAEADAIAAQVVVQLWAIRDRKGAVWVRFGGDEDADEYFIDPKYVC